MKKLIASFLSILICFSATPGHSFCPLPGEDTVAEAPQNTPETEALWKQGDLDQANTRVSVKMLGWGLALAIGITILTIVIHQSD